MTALIILVSFIIILLSWARYDDYKHYKKKKKLLGLTGNTRVRKTAKGIIIEVQYFNKDNIIGFKRPSKEDLKFLKLTKYNKYDTVV
jgi:hypothetical protein